MSLTPDGKFLIAVLQSATRQDGGDSGKTRQDTRALVYDAADVDHLKLVHEFVVPLPVFKDAKGKTKIAAQSEIVALSDTSFLMLARDSGNGQGLKGDTSLLRQIFVVDVSAATDIAGGAFDAADKPVAPKGVLDPKLPDDYFLFVANDNDFLAQDGFQVGAPYKADDGANVDTMFLVYQVTLPGLAKK